MSAHYDTSVTGDNERTTYNPSANSGVDNAEYNPSSANVDVTGRGGSGQQTNLNSSYEDEEAARSEATGTISSREVKALQDDVWPDEKGVQGWTRGQSNDAYKQERDLDSALQQEGAIGANEV